MQRWLRIPSHRHHLPRDADSHESWWTLAVLVSLKKNILVILKVNASVSTEPAWKRLRRGMDFPSDGYRVGCPPATLPGNANVPTQWHLAFVTLFWGGGADLGPQVCSDYRRFCASSSGSWLNGLPGQDAIYQLDICLPSKWCVVSCLALDQILILHSHL